VSQSPAAGGQVPKGSTVNVVVGQFQSTTTTTTAGAGAGGPPTT
jgi:beta-lactam-binding protein with PASTA domain